MVKIITPRKAKEIALKTGIDIDDGQQTFFASSDDETEIFGFDTKRERDDFVNKRR